MRVKKGGVRSQHGGPSPKKLFDFRQPMAHRSLDIQDAPIASPQGSEGPHQNMTYLS